MDIQQLKYIAALADELHFNRAAKRTHVTQATLSQQLKKAEEELGVMLFERTTKRVALTPAGERFLPYAMSILETLNRGIHELQEENDTLSGTVRVAAIPTICPYLLPKIILDMRKKAPAVTLEIFEDTTSNLLENLRTNKYDIGILSLPIESKWIVSRLIGKESFWLAASKKSTLAKKKSVTKKDIPKERLLILQEGHCFREQALDVCHLMPDNEKIVFQGSSLTSVLNLVDANEGVTLVPAMAISNKTYPNIRFIPFNGNSPTRDIGIVWRITTPLSRAHRLLIEITEKVFKESAE